MADRKGGTTRTAFEKATKAYVPTTGPATRLAEQKARATGELNPLVDPKGFGVIRRSLPRLVRTDNGLWEMAVGMPMPIETRLDTTGSMGNNVDIAIRMLPRAYELYTHVLPGYDLQISMGMFGDVSDELFVLCRPQFEMEADKIVQQLTLMVPERDGGDIPEDPHYGLFGAAYLTSTYISAIGLKGYDNTISDAPARHLLDESQLRRIYGNEVFEKAAENGHQITPRDLPTTSEVVQDLLKIAHVFFYQVGDHDETTRFWVKVFGRERVVILPTVEMLPQVQAVVIGLTEGTLSLSDVEEFLRHNNVNSGDARRIVRSVANVPIGAQAALANFHKRPQKGDLFQNKPDVLKRTDLWPVDPGVVRATKPLPTDFNQGPNWL